MNRRQLLLPLRCQNSWNKISISTTTRNKQFNKQNARCTQIAVEEWTIELTEDANTAENTTFLDQTVSIIYWQWNQRAMYSLQAFISKVNSHWYWWWSWVHLQGSVWKSSSSNPSDPSCGELRACEKHTNNINYSWISENCTDPMGSDQLTFILNTTLTCSGVSIRRRQSGGTSYALHYRGNTIKPSWAVMG